MDTLILYFVVAVLFTLSFVKDRKKTRQALLKGIKAVEGILPQLVTVLLLIAMMLAALNAEVIGRLIGSGTGAIGVAIAAVFGAITLIPGFVAFPLAGELLKNGAGVMQIATFVSSLMMVGVITFPMEVNYFGKRTALARNILAFFFSIIAAAFVSWAGTL